MMQTALGGAGLAVAFNAPIGGTLFTLEEVTKSFRVKTVLATLCAAATAVGVVRWMLGNRPDFLVEPMATPQLRWLWLFAVFGVLCGLLGAAYNRLVLWFLDRVGAIRRVRREVPGALEVITAHCSAHDYDDPGKPKIAWNDAEAREMLVDALVSDAHRLLGHLPERELDATAADAVALLALLAGQDVEPVEGSDGTDGRWRIAQRVAPDRVISTVDPDARHAHKTVARRQDGFKAHIAVEPDTGIITDCALTKASGTGSSDAAVGIDLLAGEPEALTVLADSAYGSGELRAELVDAGHRDRVKPAPPRSAVPGGFTVDDFTVDHANRTATCPAGLRRTISATGVVTFGAACRGCGLRQRCTTSTKGKTLAIRPHDELQRNARAAARNMDWLNEYRQHRPMVERSIAWLTRGNRKVRYRGVIKNGHWLHHRAAAINLRRLITLGLGHTGTSWALA